LSSSAFFPSLLFRNQKLFLSLSRLRASLARFERKSKIKKQSLRRSRSFSARSSQPSIERSFASVDLIHLFARGEKIDRAREKGGGGCFFLLFVREKSANTRGISDFVFIFDFPRKRVGDIFRVEKKQKSSSLSLFLCVCGDSSSFSSLLEEREKGRRTNYPNKKRWEEKEDVTFRCTRRYLFDCSLSLSESDKNTDE